MDIGAAVSSKTLLTDEELADIAQFENSPLFNEREKWVMRYAEAMSQTSVTVPDALFAQLKLLNPICSFLFIKPSDNLRLKFLQSRGE